MQQLPYRSPPSLLARIIGGLVAVTTLIVGLTVGFALFLIILGLAAIAILAFYARLYWLRRRVECHAQRAGRASSGQAQRHQVIEGEYRVERERR